MWAGSVGRWNIRGLALILAATVVFSKSKEVVELWNEILPDDFIERPRMSRIYYEGKFYSYPLRAFEALWNLGVVRSTLCMVSYATAKLLPKKKVRSFEDWTINQFGRKLYSIFFKIGRAHV